MTRLSYVNIMTRDLELLPGFYVDLLGLSEFTEIRSEVFRAFGAGPTRLGFNSIAVYQRLGWPGQSHDGAGVTIFLSFELDSVSAVDRGLMRAIELGGTLIKPAYHSDYGLYQGFLLDPERNGLRLSCPSSAS